MRTLSVIAFSLTVLLGVGCKKDEKKPAPAGDMAKPADPAAKPADPAAAPADPAMAGGSAAPAAPAGTDKAPAAPAAPASPDEAKAVELMTKMGKVFEGAGTDCKKLATDIKAFAKDNKDAMLAMKKWEDTQTPEQKKEMEKKYQPQMEAMMKSMGPAMQACASDKDVEAAFKELPLN